MSDPLRHRGIIPSNLEQGCLKYTG
jgi:hypothetical protein